MKRAILFSILFGAIAGLGFGQQAWTTVKMWDSGPSANRFDVVIMGDGYTAAQIPLFRTHCANFVNYFLGVAPFSRYQNHINFWRVEVESTQSGADHPAPCYTTPILVTTALDAAYCTSGTQRCITTNSTTVTTTAMINVPAYDKIIVLVNDPEYGGCASGIICNTSSVHSSFLEIATHELGHTMFGLADEYWSSGAVWAGGQPSQPNVANQNQATMLSAQSKWWYWIGTEGVGAFEGGLYNEFGIWRPKPNCRMQSLGVDFCPVCREEALSDTWSYAPAWDSVVPAVQGVQAYGTTFTVTGPALSIGALTSEWLIDGTIVSAGTQTTVGNVTTYSYSPAAALLGQTGSHTVVFRIQDTTAWYRKVSPYRPAPTLTWTVNDTFSDYTMLALAADQAPSAAGRLFHVTDSVKNNGVTAGPPVVVNYYLSSDANITTSDFLCGSRTVPALQPGAVDNGSASLRVPYGTLFTSLRLGAIVDGDQSVLETSESNNAIVLPSPYTIATANTLNASAFAVTLATGSSGTLFFNAGAAEAGRAYFVLVSLASPGGGTDMGPFIGIAPIIADTFTTDVLNGAYPPPIFQGMQGILNGTGQATISWQFPALGPGMPQGVMRFWAFDLATDPISGAVSIPRTSNRVDLLLL